MSNGEDQEAKVFFVDSRYEQMARRPGGVSREQALGSAKAKIDKIRPPFGDWLDQELQALGELIRQAESHGSNADWIDAAYLVCRRIRDTGTTMGFALVTFVANNLCEILEAIKSGAEYRADLIDCHIQALLLSKQERYRNLRPEQLPELSLGLRKVAEYVPKIAVEKDGGRTDEPDPAAADPKER